MYCKNCGEKLKPEHTFCKNCGTVAVKSKVQTNKLKYWFNLLFAKIKKPLVWMGVVGVIVIILLIRFIGHSSSSIIVDNKPAVVDIVCDNGYAGSGTLFTSDGTILTNNHVVAYSTSCLVTIPNPDTGKIEEIYTATPIVTPSLSEDYDIATLKINGAFTDSDGKIWGEYPTTFKPFISPSKCDGNTAPKLGDSVRIYGYPVTSGNYNLTVTDGIISNFSNDGSILTSAKVDSGNSGGLAVDQNGCWLGLPSAVISGDYQNLGVIIPGQAVQKILSNVPAKVQPADIGDYKPASVTNKEFCNSLFGKNSIWSGEVGSSGTPTCMCDTGYSWDTTGNSCATNISLQYYCENNYGTGAYSNIQGGKTVCSCGSGYVWNAYKTACVVKPTCPSFSSYNSTSEKCECWSGYRATGSICESMDIYCSDTYGYGSSYDYTSEKCQCDSGYVFNGGRCESGYSYCSGKFGTGIEYNSLTGKCQCSYGYEVNSSGTKCVSIYSNYNW